MVCFSEKRLKVFTGEYTSDRFLFSIFNIFSMNKPIFWVGIAIIVITAILLLTVKEDLGTWPMTMGIMGIVFIVASKYGPMKQKK